jgi:hypothetical protein
MKKFLIVMERELTQITTFVHLCFCNNNVILKMAAITAET